MSKAPIQPSTLDGIKRYAKALKSSENLKHSTALDAAAVAGGFHNYTHARRHLENNLVRPQTYLAYITADWRIEKTLERGQETLLVNLAMPLNEMVSTTHLKKSHLADFRFSAPDHLIHKFVANSQSSARRHACAAARTLIFMETTGFRPARSTRRAYPNSNPLNAMPEYDHTSIWHDPVADSYIFADEPYSRLNGEFPQNRITWAQRHGWEIVRTKSFGMYYPDGGCELYLAADKSKGYSLAPVLKALDALPPPPMEGNWNGQTTMFPARFVSPGALKKKAKSENPPRKGKTGPRLTISYQMAFSGKRSRPKARMPVSAHAEVGKLLKSVLSTTHNRRGVYNRLNAIRSELDDWVQCEFSHQELPNEQFFNLYYHNDTSSHSIDKSLRDKHIQSLESAKSILVLHYPECPPLRKILNSIDAALKSLRTWSL